MSLCIMCSVIDMYVVVFVFVFKQKTAYEMRISDWSSDVCSSDLAGVSACFGVSLVSRVRDLENVGGDAAAVINREAALAGRVSRRFLASLGAAIFDQSEHTIRIWLEDRLVVRIRPLVGREPPKDRKSVV